jgi:NTP pyrophosphatase (non-canonical NTP hydrolase)
MNDSAINPLTDLRDLIREFAQERDWDQFHSPKNLAISVSIEAAELLEQFQWLPTGHPSELSEEKRIHVQHEIADVLVYLIRLADKLDIDLAASVREKLRLNGEKYPADKVRGDARKYTEY